MTSLKKNVEALANVWVPRMLTQMDRDPTSSTYGCADRNWWHYKIRDFPSIILQQAGYAVFLASRMPAWSADKEGLHKLACASCSFWSDHLSRRKSFDEYYPWEHGYPPLAFSSLAALKLAHDGVVDRNAIRPAVTLAARQLVERFEHQAANQQVAGLAALLWLRKLYPDLVEAKDAAALTRRTLALQDSEGWYMEYGGPDLGYLSVTMDCLWDAFDATGDEQFVTSAEKALLFIDQLAVIPGSSIGMHNARNTDYIVPYGLVRFIKAARGRSADVAAALVQRLYRTLDQPGHFLRATDDRYICHYIGHSVIRAWALLDDAGIRDENEGVSARSASTRAPMHFEHSGHVVYPRGLLSLNKGGIFTFENETGEAVSDFGWMFDVSGTHYVTHWWSDRWICEQTDGGWRVSGDCVPCREHISTPWKHMALRIASLVLGRGLIKHLKKVMIFKKHESPYRFTRRVHVADGRIIVDDEVSGLPDGVDPQPAPRASRRHVASADSYHPQDFTPVAPAWTAERTVQRSGGVWAATTTYSLASETRETASSPS